MAVTRVLPAGYVGKVIDTMELVNMSSGMPPIAPPESITSVGGVAVVVQSLPITVSKVVTRLARRDCLRDSRPGSARRTAAPGCCGRDVLQQREVVADERRGVLRAVLVVVGGLGQGVDVLRVAVADAQVIDHVFRVGGGAERVADVDGLAGGVAARHARGRVHREREEIDLRQVDGAVGRARPDLRVGPGGKRHRRHLRTVGVVSVEARPV